MAPRLLRRPGFWLAGVPLIALLARATFGAGGLFEVKSLLAERARLRDEVFARLGENDRLRQRILEIRRFDRTVERMARLELGLVGDGEIVYRFPAGAGARRGTPGRSRAAR